MRIADHLREEELVKGTIPMNKVTNTCSNKQYISRVRIQIAYTTRDLYIMQSTTTESTKYLNDFY
jgi:hypothetical protein